ncbi:NAD(P)-binding domain-containing protein [Acidisoma cellulosilytica]|uniref:NAD(P)-binding domain-containing protein n=1 Tax=Acidisoma cellulosilyticum TaxID=2802395 RepID=A0A963YYT8_9PROT|nr:NAD(P)-binding domain-containing protein [Acidisoma cellulosilyticum]MCB8879324.1 NAD(P)-binding domain-containing protein [Acidisoma cellulosilyticum]
MRIGSIGAGFLARAFARRAIAAGHQVMLSNARGPKTLTSVPSGTGATIGTAEDAAAFGDIVFLALPFAARDSLADLPLAGKIVLDANNYYPERDGVVADLDEQRTTTSGMIAALLPQSRLVKAFNAILAVDLEPGSSLLPSGARRALPIAGEDAAAKAVVAGLHAEIGFDALDAGGLAESWRFERAKPAYCIPLDLDGMIAALAAAKRDEALPHGSWRP